LQPDSTRGQMTTLRCGGEGGKTQIPSKREVWSGTKLHGGNPVVHIIGRMQKIGGVFGKKKNFVKYKS